MTNCNDPRKSCGQIIPSSCVPYVGTKPYFIPDSYFPCDVNVTDMIQLANTEIDGINDNQDLSSLDKKCLDFVPSTVKIKQLHQLEIDKICSMSESLATLSQSFADLNIGTEIVTVDLGEMTPSSNPCSLSTNQYTLFYVLQAFANELNAIKSNLGI